MLHKSERALFSTSLVYGYFSGRAPRKDQLPWFVGGENAIVYQLGRLANRKSFVLACCLLGPGIQEFFRMFAVWRAPVKVSQIIE